LNDHAAKPVIVERRNIIRPPLLLRLPYPPSPARLGRDPSAGSSEDHRCWCERAALALPKPRARLKGPVEIAMTFKERSGRQQLDAASRQVLGFLMARGVIDDDGAKTVRKMVLDWGTEEGVLVEIRSAQSNGISRQ
jgi:hypothetical protein